MTMLARFFHHLAETWLQSTQALVPAPRKDGDADVPDCSERDDHRAFHVFMTHWL